MPSNQAHSCVNLSLALLLVLVLSVSPMWAATGRSKDTRIVFDEAVPGATAFSIIDGVCLNFRSALAAGDILFGMERVDGPNGTIFWSESGVVENFPEKVEFVIEATISLCRPDFPRAPSPLGLLVPIPVETPDYVRSPHFEAWWVKGGQTRAAEIISFGAYQVPFREAGPDVWYYTLKIRSENVSLTDELVVSLLVGQNTPIMHLHAGLLWPPPGAFVRLSGRVALDTRCSPSLSGRLVDRSRQPVPDALVELFDEGTKKRIGFVRSDQNGKFTFPQKKGAYVLKAKKQGYAPCFCHVRLDKTDLDPLVLRLDLAD